MKPFAISILVLATFSLAAARPQSDAHDEKSVFYGEISDSQCAMNVHSLSGSHQEMIAKGTLGHDAASCARACVRRGGLWVLRSGDVVYRLKDQVGVDEYAGQKVRVLGTLDPKTQTINNITIQMLPANSN